MMLRKIFHLLVLVGALAQFAIAQSTDDEKNKRIEKANKILKAARDVIYKGVERSEINAMWIEKQITSVETKVLFEGASDRQGAKSRVIADEEVMVSFPDRLKSVTIAYIPETDPNPNDNFSKVELTVNGEDAEFKQLVVFNGKEFGMKELIKAEGASKEEIKKRLKKLKEIQRKMQTKEFAYQLLWASVFPVLLDLPWDDVETRFIIWGRRR